ncbi:hypothetical protein BDN67DRAFT_986036 [Paxillus ammoniavirescens]|nr:hypothetical protein BDN67DRAFT_986036 [Paxillus ammoniavirescens]
MLFTNIELDDFIPTLACFLQHIDIEGPSLTLTLLGLGLLSCHPVGETAELRAVYHCVKRTLCPYGRPGVIVLTERSPTGLKTVFRVSSLPTSSRPLAPSLNAQKTTSHIEGPSTSSRSTAFHQGGDTTMDDAHERYGVGRLPYRCWDVRSALDVKVKDRDEECHAHDEEEHCRRRRRWTDDTMDVPGEGAEADDFSGESITDNKGDFEQVKMFSLTLTSQTLIENTEHSESPVQRRHLCTLLACMNASILEAFQSVTVLTERSPTGLKTILRVFLPSPNLSCNSSTCAITCSKSTLRRFPHFIATLLYTSQPYLSFDFTFFCDPGGGLLFPLLRLCVWLIFPLPGLMTPSPPPPTARPSRRAKTAHKFINPTWERKRAKQQVKASAVSLGALVPI